MIRRSGARQIKQMLVAAGLTIVSAPVLAQPDAPPLEPIVVPSEPEPATPDAPPAAPPLDNARLDDVEQTARIAARQVEVFKEEQANRAKETPGLGADDKGFVVKSGDGSYVLKFRSLLQADGRFFLHDDAAQANDTFLLRRFRPSIDGTLFSLVDFRLLPDFAGTAPAIYDGYFDLHPWPWLHLRAGKFKGPLGLERLQTDADLPLLERALDQNLTPQRDVGVQLWGDIGDGVLEYSIGVFNGNVDGTLADSDVNHAKDFAGRIFVRPLRYVPGAGSLGIGIAGSIGNRKGRLPNNSQLPSFKTSGQTTFFSYYAPATDTTGVATTFAFKQQSHFNPQLYYYYENIGLLGEYVRSDQSVQRGDATAALMHQGAHATLSYVFGGRASYEGVTPLVPFDTRNLGAGVGAVEIAVRVSWIEVDPATYGNPKVSTSVQYADPTKNVHSATAWGGGIAWVPRRSFHLAFNYERTTFVGGGGGTALAPLDRIAENVIIGRGQVAF